MNGTGNADTKRVHRNYIILLIVLTGIVLFYRLGTLPLIDRDETRYAIMARGMLDRHDWLVPFLDNKPHPDKPPLFMWMVAISFKLLGVNEFSARLIPALMALGTILTVYFLGTLLFTPRTGFLAGLILAASAGFVAPARFVITDMMLTFFTTLAIALVMGGLIYKKPWMYLVSYLAFSGAMLTKGPVGIALPTLILLLYLWKTKQLPSIKEMYLGWGVVIILILSLPWYILVDRRLPGYLYFFFIRENILRFLTETHHRSGPIYYYIPVVLVGLFPWIWFLPSSLLKQKNSWWNEPSRFFCFTWFLVGFVFFSLSGSKLPTYLLPYVAPAVLLIAYWWDRIILENQSNRWLTSLAITLSVLGLLLIILGLAIPLSKFDPEIRSSLHWPMWTESILLIAMGICFYISAKLKKLSWSFGVIALFNLAIMFHLVFFAEGHKFAESHSTRELCQKLNPLLQKKDYIVVYHPNRWSVSFYLKSAIPPEYINSLREIAMVLNHPGKVYAILQKPNDVDELQKQVNVPLHILATEGGQTLVSN